jgi:hypothetical protein
MSVVQNTLIGRARQKIGGSVFSSWKGINVLKSKPLTVANPQTDAQMVQRNALTLLTETYRAVSGAVQIGFKQQAIRKSEFNAFTSYNLKNAIDKSGAPVAALIPAQMLFAQGTVAATAITSTTATHAAGTITVDFNSNVTGPGQSSTDGGLLVAYVVQTKKFYQVPNNNVRSDGSSTGVIGAGAFAAGNTVDVWSFFINQTTRKVSDSVYSTCVAT